MPSEPIAPSAAPVAADDAPTGAAHFNPLIRTYVLVMTGVVMLLSIVGIPFALIWFCGVGQAYARRYFDSLECELDDVSLRYRMGIFVQTEKTIPLENIQDVTFIEGPLLRRFDLATLKFETAGGQGAGDGSDMQLTGIIDAQGFRRRILDARRRLREGTKPAPRDERQSEDRLAEALDGIARRLDRLIELAERAR